MPHQKNLVQLIKIPKISDDAFLIFGQTPDHIPFKIQRIYYLIDSDPKLPRGFHAHHKNRQLLFCMRGSIRLVLDDGKRRQEILLDQPEHGLLINPLIWHEMHDFKTDTILLVLASRKFEPADYIRDYEQFLKIIGR